MLVPAMGGHGLVGRLTGGTRLCFFPLEHIGMAAWKLGDGRIGGLPVAGLGHYGRTGLQRLMLQRRVILSDQQTAEREVADLAERLEHVHAPLEDRLRAYERRIAELEAELAARGEQNLELIKARIETTRRKLDGERTRESQESLNLG